MYLDRGGDIVKEWMKAILVAAATALILMYGIDFLETYFRAMTWVQQDIINYHEEVMKKMTGGK